MSNLKTNIANSIYSKVKLTAIGNSNRKMKDVAIDCIHEQLNQGHSIKYVADLCYLTPKTISNLIEEVTKNPQSETLERIFRACEMTMTLEHGAIKSKYMNKPKGD